MKDKNTKITIYTNHYKGHLEPCDIFTNVLNDSEEIPYPMSAEQIYNYLNFLSVNDCCLIADNAIINADNITG